MSIVEASEGHFNVSSLQLPKEVKGFLILLGDICLQMAGTFALKIELEFSSSSYLLPMYLRVWQISLNLVWPTSVDISLYILLSSYTSVCISVFAMI